MHVYIAELKSPVLQSFPTLDALLMNQLTAMFDGDYKKAQKEVPIKCVDKLFQCSSAIIESPEPYRRSFTASLRAENKLPLSDVLSKGGKYTKIDKKGRKAQFGSIMNTYYGFSGLRVWWFFDGDKQAVDKLMEGVLFIGKRHTNGNGELGERSIEQAKVTILDNNGRPLRPIPFNRFDGDSPIVDAAWKPAYWDFSNRDQTVLPEQIYSSQMLEEML